MGEEPIIEEVDEDDPIKVDAELVYSRRPSKEHEHRSEDKVVNDSNESGGSDGGGSGLEDEAEVNPSQREFVEHCNDIWDGKGDDDDDDDGNDVEAGQMGTSVMNSDYESEELHNFDESSTDDEIGDNSDDSFEDDEIEDDSDDNFEDNIRTLVGKEKVEKPEKRRNFLMFKPIAKAEHIRFEKDMFFTIPKQFKEAITKYAVHGGWGIRFAKIDLLRIRVFCQPNYKFVAYLTKVTKERNYQLRTLTMDHTCSRSYKNLRCASLYIKK